MSTKGNVKSGKTDSTGYGTGENTNQYSSNPKYENSSSSANSSTQTNNTNNTNKITQSNQSNTEKIEIEIPILSVNLYLLLFSEISPILFFTHLQDLLKTSGYKSQKNIKMIPGSLKTYNKYKFEIHQYYFEKLKRLRPLFKKIDEIYHDKPEDRQFSIKKFSSKDNLTERKLNEKLKNLINNKPINNQNNKPKDKENQNQNIKKEDLFLYAAIFVILSNDNNKYNDKDLENFITKMNINIEKEDKEEKEKEKEKIKIKIKSIFDLFINIFELDLDRNNSKERYSLKDVSLNRNSRNPMLDYFQNKSDELISLNKHIKKLDLLKSYEFEYHQLLDLEIEKIKDKQSKINDYQLRKTQRKVELELDLTCLEYLCLKPIEFELNHIGSKKINITNNTNAKTNTTNYNNSFPNNNNSNIEYGDYNLPFKFKVYKINETGEYFNNLDKVLFQVKQKSNEKTLDIPKIRGLNKLKGDEVRNLRELLKNNLQYVEKVVNKDKKSIYKKEIFKDLTQNRMRYGLESESSIKKALKEFF
jgi:hypothetical protein